jgi:hypothetical protein
MKTTLLLLCAIALSGGCTRTFDQPAAVSSDRAAARPAGGLGSAAAGATVPAAACSWAGNATSNGGMSCQQGQQFRCSNGTWQQTALSC